MAKLALCALYAIYLVMTAIRAYSSLRVLEAFHVRLLLQLASRCDGKLYLKGGVNLRLFYGSIRYSEDMDFDADRFLLDRLRRTVPQLIQHATFIHPLQNLGLQAIEMVDEPAKHSDTTLRFKMQLILGGGVGEPTKVEFSFRGDNKNAEPPPEAATVGTPVEEVIADYVPAGTRWDKVLYYPRPSALWQKLRALALRTEVQARDVFDLHHLSREQFGEVPFSLLRGHLSRETLEKAEARTMDVDPAQFEEKVVRYLPEEHREGLVERWDDMRTEVSYMIQDILRATPQAGTPFAAEQTHPDHDGVIEGSGVNETAGPGREDRP